MRNDFSEFAALKCCVESNAAVDSISMVINVLLAIKKPQESRNVPSLSGSQKSPRRKKPRSFPVSPLPAHCRETK